MPNPRPAQTALFRALATARLRGDAADAARLAAQITDGRRMQHLLFQTMLLSQVIVDEVGAAPDPGDLAELTKRLHDKHFRNDPNFNALRAEAMIRAMCGESVLLTEIQAAEQPGYIWAVISELVDPDSTDEDLAERFDVAEEVGLECLTEAFESTIRDHPRRTARAQQDSSQLETTRAAKPESSTMAALELAMPPMAAPDPATEEDAE